jgi:basic amino acid/polyamine antiporter, APA family
MHQDATMTIESDPAHPEVALQRSLTFGPLLFYGLAVIIGAGIYVAIASVIGRAGATAPLSFLLAGVAAAMTGLCYAELASRFPEASGAVAYVKQGFGSDRAAQLTGVALTLAVAIAAASIASGAVHYLSLLFGLPPKALIALLVATFTLLAIAGVRESTGFAAVIGAVEILGLVVAAGVGFLAAPTFDIAAMLPASFTAWQSVVAGAFIAFFAFIGFESLANMSEEAKDPRRTVPYSIVGAVLVSTLLYVVVAAALIFAGRGGQSPLIDLFQGPYATLFAAVGALAIANGVLVEIMMLARLFYGMARRQQLPAVLGRVHSWTRTPIQATALAGGIVLATALLVPFERLLALANGLTLGIFAVVDIALWRIQRRQPAGEDVFAVPRWVPPAAAALAVGLIVAQAVP